MFGTYECVGCETLVEYKKPHGEEWPESFKKKCEKCGKSTKHVRNYGAGLKTLVFDVAQGRTGNAANGYSNTGDGTDFPGKFTPLNKFYGKGGRTAGVETEHHHGY